MRTHLCSARAGSKTKYSRAVVHKAGIRVVHRASVKLKSSESLIGIKRIWLSRAILDEKGYKGADHTPRQINCPWMSTIVGMGKENPEISKGTNQEKRITLHQNLRTEFAFRYPLR